jgi:hypothetical protein
MQGTFFQLSHSSRETPESVEFRYETGKYS